MKCKLKYGNKADINPTVLSTSTEEHSRVIFIHHGPHMNYKSSVRNEKARSFFNSVMWFLRLENISEESDKITCHSCNWPLGQILEPVSLPTLQTGYLPAKNSRVKNLP